MIKDTKVLSLQSVIECMIPIPKVEVSSSTTTDPTDKINR